MSGWAVLAIVPAFGIDTLVVAAGLGAAGVADRRRLALTIALFEGLMPLVGALIGNWLGALISGYAVWAAAVLLTCLGIYEVLAGLRELRQGEDGEEEAAERLEALERKLVGAGILVAGLSVSMDELAAGLAAGAAELPLVVLVPALALQAALFTYLGLHAGHGIRRLAGRYGEVVAGVALFLAAIVVVVLAQVGAA
jgi:putative Mn2+ efflux pump MntP